MANASVAEVNTATALLIQLFLFSMLMLFTALILLHQCKDCYRTNLHGARYRVIRAFLRIWRI